MYLGKQDFDPCLILNHLIFTTESLTLAETQNLHLDISILADVFSSQPQQVGILPTPGKLPTEADLHGRPVNSKKKN